LIDARRALVLSLAFSLGFAAVVEAASTLMAGLRGPRTELLQSLNDTRAAHGAPALRASRSLAHAARREAMRVARFGSVIADPAQLERVARERGWRGSGAITTLVQSRVPASKEWLRSTRDAWLAEPGSRGRLLDSAANAAAIAMLTRSDGSRLCVVLLASD
jgi:uncharacterized protein YkwD